MEISKQKTTFIRKYLNFYEVESGEIRWGFPVMGDSITPCLDLGYTYKKCKEEDCPWWKNYLKVSSDDSYYSRLEEETIKEPAIGICDICGGEVPIIDMFYGSCKCPQCGQWYTLSGQRCLPPEEQMKCPDW